jgi:hypothetical protein
MLRRGNGNAHDKRGSGAQLALQAHGSTVRLYDSFDQVQTESGAVDLILHGLSSAEERVEYALLFLRRNSRAVIGDADFDLLSFRAVHLVRGHVDPLPACRSPILGRVG